MRAGAPLIYIVIVGPPARRVLPVLVLIRHMLDLPLLKVALKTGCHLSRSSPSSSLQLPLPSMPFIHFRLGQATCALYTPNFCRLSLTPAARIQAGCHIVLVDHLLVTRHAAGHRQFERKQTKVGLSRPEAEVGVHVAVSKNGNSPDCAFQEKLPKKQARIIICMHTTSHTSDLSYREGTER